MIKFLPFSYTQHGLGSTKLNKAEASQWYLLAAQQGLTLAMVNLANLQREGGYDEAAYSWYYLAARWGNADARTALTRWGKAVPSADLLNQKIVKDEVLKRDLFEGEKAEETKSMIQMNYRKIERAAKAKKAVKTSAKTETAPPPSNPIPDEAAAASDNQESAD